MSIRAYLEVTPPVLAKAPTFNVSADQDLLDELVLLDDCSACCEDYDQIELYIPSVEAFLQSDRVKQYDPVAIAELQNDINSVKTGDNEGFITYHCF